MNQIETILNSPCGKLNRHLETKPEKKKIIKARNDCQQVQKIHWDLKYYCEEKGLLMIPELKFYKKRKFRFDFAIMKGITEIQARNFQYGKENIICAIEYDGLNSEKSGHTTLTGFTSDTEKINLAISEGWRVLRYTVLNYQNVLQDIEKLIKPK